MNLLDIIQERTSRVPLETPGSIEVGFFGLVLPPPLPTIDALRAAIQAHRGEFCECNPLDGKEHSYIELGAWVGDQGMALRLMGLGKALGLWNLHTPQTLFGSGLDPITRQQMAEGGFVTITSL